MELLWFVLIGAFAAWVAGRIMRGNGFGLPGNIVVGVLGAFTGGYLFRAVGVELGVGVAGGLLVAFAGAMALLFAAHLFTRRRAGPRSWS